MRALTCLAVLVLVLCGDALTQEPILQPGQRVRVTVPTVGIANQEETFREFRADTLMLASTSYLLADVTALHAHTGRKGHRWLGAVVGGVVGGTVGALLATSDCLGDACVGSAVLGGVGGLLGGALLGAVVGGSFTSDRWEEIPLEQLRIGVMSHGDGRFAFGVALAY